LRAFFFEQDFVFQGAFCGDLVEPGFEQSESYVAKQENAGDEQETLSPAKKRWLAR
jgi:hypothetical protein